MMRDTQLLSEARLVAAALGLNASVAERHDVDLLCSRALSRLAVILDTPAAVQARRMALLQAADPTADAGALAALDRNFGQDDDVDWAKSFADDAKSGWALVLALLTCFPLGQSGRDPAWHYIGDLLKAAAADTENAHELWGWLNSTAAPDVAAKAETMLSELATRSPFLSLLVRTARTERQERLSVYGAADYGALRAQVSREAASIHHLLHEMNVASTEYASLASYLENDGFRLTVLGEFKRGKSTFLNALLGSPDLLPTHDLPCTSGVIEVRGGLTTGVERQSGANTWAPSSVEAMKISAGDAHRRGSSHSASEPDVKYWRVTLPSAFLADAHLVVVDTPGLGEDPARDRIARTEASRADAAVLLVSMQQPFSSLERALLEKMRSKAADLFIVVNFADQKPESAWISIVDHIRRELSSEGVLVDADRVIPPSASQALEGQRLGQTSGWTDRLDRLSRSLASHLRGRSAAARRESLSEHVKRFKAAAVAAASRRLELLRARRDDINDLAVRREEKRVLEERARASLARALQHLRTHREASERFWNAFAVEIPKMLAAVGAGKDSWQSGHDPVLSPKKFATEVGNEARDALLRLVEQWINTSGTELLIGALDNQTAAARSEIADYAKYVSMTTGKSADQVWDELRIRGLQLAFPREFSSVDATGVALRGVVTMVVGVILGYVIADVVLFYILGMISGFLNPVLLVSAVVLGVGAYFLMGRTFVKAWVRSKVFEKIEEELLGEARLLEVRGALDAAVRELFTRNADGFELGAQDLLTEILVQQRAADQRLSEAEERSGKRGAMDAELARLVALEAQIMVKFAGLDTLLVTRAQLPA